jgi:tetratricopeptide (TPR) repeat protein
LEDFDRARELLALDVRILESKGNAKITLRDHRGALEDFDRAHELDPCDVGILRSRGNVKVALHDHQGALEDFDRACDFACDARIFESRKNVKIVWFDHRGALEEFNRAHELDPCDVVILRSQANVKMTLYDHQGALQDLDRVHTLDSFDVETLRLRGHVKRMMGDLKGSIMDWAMAHGLPYDDIVYFGNRAFVKRRLENYDGVVGELNHKQEFDFLLSLKKLILQLVVFFVVIVIFVFEYLMGYVERGQWGTYSNGTWEFRATYVCIELRLGSYPFQKFREKPPSRSYIGIRTKERIGRNGKYIRYEPHLKLNNDAFYFRECKTRVKAAFIYDIAKLCLGVKDGNFNMLCPQRYDHLQKISVEGHTKKEISKIVLECA